MHEASSLRTFFLCEYLLSRVSFLGLSLETLRQADNTATSHIMPKRKFSEKGSTPTSSAPKRPKIRKSRVAISTPVSPTEHSSSVQLCSYCTSFITVEGMISRNFDLTNEHWDYICEKKKDLNCASCELIGNAMPINDLLKVTKEYTPGSRYKKAWIMAAKNNRAEIRATKTAKLYGTLVRSGRRVHEPRKLTMCSTLIAIKLNVRLISQR